MIPESRIEEIYEKVIFPLFQAKDLQYRYKEYAAFCNINHGEIKVGEVYRSERHIIKSDRDR